LTAIEIAAFRLCPNLQTLLVSPPPPTIPHLPTPPDAAGLPPQLFIWPALPTTHIPTLVRIHAPDHIVAQLGGRFEEYARFADLLPHMRVALQATTLAAIKLWMWWSPP
jgi:hypothetical protein